MQLLHIYVDSDVQILHTIGERRCKTMTALKELRQSKKLTQRQVAELLGISLRSYITYESDPDKEGTLKYKYLQQELERRLLVDENHGLLTKEEIISSCSGVFEKYPVDYCYLFGSYAKGTATETSDVDLLVSTDVTGMQFFELTERLRETLHKRVDLLDLKQLANNEDLLNEVLKEGIKIYG